VLDAIAQLEGVLDQVADQERKVGANGGGAGAACCVGDARHKVPGTPG
jgi:hypothetical protein